MATGNSGRTQATKRVRHETILELVREHRIHSQQQLRDLLGRRGFDVTQATLSRDMRELRLVKAPDAAGRTHYTLPAASAEQTPPLQRLLPTLFLSAEGAGNLLVVKTLTGSAQPVAVAIDAEEWPELLGTIAGDDTILIILRDPDRLHAVRDRIHDLAAAAPHSP